MTTVTEHAEAKVLMLKLLELAQRMEERDARVIALLGEQGARLEAGARDLQAGGQRLAADALQSLRGQAREVVQAGVGDAAAGYRERLGALTADAARASGELRACADALRRQRRLWGWTAPLALLAGSVLAVGAATYAVLHAQAEVERHRIEASLLRAYNAADVTLCDGRLCANVDPRPPAADTRGRYRLVRPRTAPPAP